MLRYYMTLLFYLLIALLLQINSVEMLHAITPLARFSDSVSVSSDAVDGLYSYHCNEAYSFTENPSPHA